VLLWAQSAHVHYHRAAAEAGFVELNGVVQGWLTGPRVLTADQSERVRATIKHASFAERGTPFTLFPHEDWELSLIVGWLELLRGNEEVFRARLEHAGEVFEHDAISRNGLANYHAAAGEVGLALDWFERAREAAPGDPGTWTAWSGYLISLGRLDEARALLERAAAGELPHERIFLALGRLELSAGRLPEAVTAFRSALHIDSRLLEAHMHLGGLLLELGDLPGAIEHLEQALLQRPRDFALELQATLAYDRLGDLEGAERHARAARRIAPRRPEPLVALGRIARARGDEERAQRLLDEAKKIAQVPSSP